MGADEYLLGSGQADRLPAVPCHGPGQLGANAKEIDVFIDFINKVNAHVKSKGKTLRIWNDGLKPFNIVQLDKDIIVEFWTHEGLTPTQILTRGNDMVNADGRLYFTATARGGSAAARWNENWTPENFWGHIAADSSTEGKVLGAKPSLWPDNGPGMTENELFAMANDTIHVVAQATWGSPRPVSTFAEFTALTAVLAPVPATPRSTGRRYRQVKYAVRAGSSS